MYIYIYIYSLHVRLNVLVSCLKTHVAADKFKGSALMHVKNLIKSNSIWILKMKIYIPPQVFFSDNVSETIFSFAHLLFTNTLSTMNLGTNDETCSILVISSFEVTVSNPSNGCFRVAVPG